MKFLTQKKIYIRWTWIILYKLLQIEITSKINLNDLCKEREQLLLAEQITAIDIRNFLTQRVLQKST